MQLFGNNLSLLVSNICQVGSEFCQSVPNYFLLLNKDLSEYSTQCPVWLMETGTILSPAGTPGTVPSNLLGWFFWLCGQVSILLCTQGGSFTVLCPVKSNCVGLPELCFFSLTQGIHIPIPWPKNSLKSVTLGNHKLTFFVYHFSGMDVLCCLVCGVLNNIVSSNQCLSIYLFIYSWLFIMRGSIWSEFLPLDCEYKLKNHFIK